MTAQTSFSVIARASQGSSGENAPRYLARVFNELVSESRAWIWISLTALIEAIFALASPHIASRVLDTALPNSARGLLRTLAILIVIAVAHTAWAGWLHRSATILLRLRLETRCLCGVLQGYLSMPYIKAQMSDFGTTSEALGAASTIVSAVVNALVQGITLGASGTAALALLAYYAPGLAAVTVCIAALTGLVSSGLAYREARFAGRVLDASSRTQEFLHVLLRAVPTLRASGATPRLAERWERLVRSRALEVIAQENARLDRTVVIHAGQSGATWFATAWLVHQTLESRISLGEMITCTMLVGNVLRVAVGVMQVGVGFLVLRPHLARIDALLVGPGPKPMSGTRKSAEIAPTCTLIAASDAAIRFDGVWFRYESQTRWVLEGANEHFPANEFTVLRASSGFGKTTMLRLIAGLLVPERGHVTVLGHDPASTPGLVAYLPQQSTLLEASIATNLTSLSGRPLKHALATAEHTGLSEWIAQLPMGVETLVSVGGGNLSAGQRQLVLLTAVFAMQTPVVLLDEATCHLDAVALARIRWPELVRGRTVISVQHV